VGGAEGAGEELAGALSLGVAGVSLFAGAVVELDSAAGALLFAA